MKGYVKLDRSHRKMDWSKARRVVFPNLKPSTTAISLRMPDAVLSRLKMKAHKQGVPYQSYIKTVLAKEVDG